ncbi:DUF1963 domain-containing protein [Sphingobacterium endophyticum]|uniref:DUF1963 domain-containing protein n=1 Tax=Sphingobacterium endophyticum TaxID=2546448 RepID=UPI0012E2EB19|nr:DUF1963 domain-containing protein [Sphingobacterium endophyticum]
MEKSFDQVQYFRVDGKDYPIDWSRTFWTIAELTSTLLTEITVDIPKDISVEENDLLDDYNPDRKIKISIESLRIFESGVPTGQTKFEEDKNPVDHKYFNKEGFEYSLKFYGTVTYRDNWVLIEGELKSPYGDSAVYSLQVAVQFNAEVLNWSKYHFKSLEETVTADPLIVRKLDIVNPTFTSLPDEVYDFKNLSYLSITKLGDYFDQSKLAFKEFDERIADLTELVSITVNKASIHQLPEDIGHLKNLEVLSINMCGLKKLPDSLWSLPNLKYLYLFSNQIREIPEKINLPSLQVLDVKENQLKTLPGSLTEQPAIKSILANDNPLEYLPNEYNSFQGLEISIEDKRNLLDYTYKGADGQGMVPWDDSIFAAESDRELIKPVDEIIRKNKLTQAREALLSLLKKAIGFEQYENEDYQKLGNHRFGGYPDLPLDIPFPSFYNDYRDKDFLYEFIAQINCEELSNLQEFLPKSGTLFFFFKSLQFFGYDDKDLAKVIYVADNGTLNSGSRFDFKEDDFFELPNAKYKAFKAKAFKVNSAPSFYAHRENRYLFEGNAQSLEHQEKLLDDLYETFEVPVLNLKKFDHAMNCYGFTQHESPELQASLSWKGNPQDWIILLEVKSIGDFQWGDAGDLFFVIHKSDLTRKDFSRIFVTMEGG